MGKQKNPHLTPALSAPRGGEGEKAARGARARRPTGCDFRTDRAAQRPGRRDRAGAPQARSQASGASARRLREDKKTLPAKPVRALR